jgi:hypothetical protein
MFTLAVAMKPPGFLNGPVGLNGQSCSYVLKKHIIAEGFREKFNRPRTQSLHSHVCVPMRSDKDYGNPAVLGVQPGLEVEARHSRHTNVSNEACGMVLLAGIQELFRRRKCPRWQADGFHQALKGTPK